MLVCLSVMAACDQAKQHIAPAVHDSDSLPFLTAHGISNLISDSGTISYRIIAEEWNIYITTPQKWTFTKGLFLEKFDTTFHVEWHVQADTAYCHDNRLWELRGRVVIRNREGTLFRSEELFWDMDAHEMWSTLFMRINTPDDEELTGYEFHSDEQMTRYNLINSTGHTPFNDDESTAAPDSTAQAGTDSTAAAPDEASMRQPLRAPGKPLHPLTR